MMVWELSDEEMNALAVSVEVTKRLLRDGESPFSGPVYRAYLARLESAQEKIARIKDKLGRPSS